MKDILKKHWYVILISLIVLFGIYLRFKGYWANTSLWCDEASLAINIRFKKFKELFDVLMCLQVAPPFFTIATKVLTSILGFNEKVFRLIPFLTGCVSIIAFYFLATKVLVKRFSIITAVLLFAINYRLIYYSYEFKPYIFDVLFTILILLFFIHFDIKKATIKEVLSYGCLLSVIQWFSFTPMLVLAGGGLYLLFKDVKHYYREKFFLFFPILMSFFLYANVYLINNYLNSGMITYWGGRENAFLAFNHHALFLIKNVVNFFFYFDKYNEVYMLSVTLLLFTIGIFVFFAQKEKAQKTYIISSLLTFIICAIVSFLGFYPMFERFVLFLLPIMLIIILKPLDIINMDKKVLSVLALTLISVFTSVQLIGLKDYLLLKQYSKRGEHPREMMQIMLKNIKPTDKIFVNQNSSPSANYYFYYFAPKGSFRYIMGPNEKMPESAYTEALNNLEEGYYWFFLAGDYSNNHQLDKTILNWANTEQDVISTYKNEDSILLYVHVIK